MFAAGFSSSAVRGGVPFHQAVQRSVAWRAVSVSLLLVALAGCAASPKDAPEAKPLASQAEPLTEILGRAQALEKLDGGRERARLLYRDAAKAYPTDKRPWLRLAQSYFDVSDYGNAVLAAQEVVQRDPADTVAHGLLAVSGLRVSTAALSALRGQNKLNTSTRSEAEDMARNLRTILGEPVLVPKPDEAAAPLPAVRPAVRRVRAAPRPATPQAPAAAPRAPAANPFGALQ